MLHKGENVKYTANTVNFFLFQSFLSVPLLTEWQSKNTRAISRHTGDVQILLGVQ